MFRVLSAQVFEESTEPKVWHIYDGITGLKYQDPNGMESAKR